MESITIKIDDAFAREVDKVMVGLYTTKTEFIRDSMRDKIKQIKKDKVFQALLKNFGASKIKTTYKEERKIREEVGRDIAKRYGIDLD